MEEEEEVTIEREEEAPKTPENKRKRATSKINFEALKNDEVEEEPEPPEDEEPPSKKARIEEKPFMPESNLPLFPAQCCLHTLTVYWPEETKSILGDQKPEDIKDVALANTYISKIRYLKGIKTGTQISEWGAGVLLQAIEDLTCELTPLNIRGFSNAKHDPEFLSLWQEVSIDMMTFQFIDPRIRLGLYLLKNAYLLNSLNNSTSSLPKTVIVQPPMQ